MLLAYARDLRKFIGYTQPRLSLFGLSAALLTLASIFEGVSIGLIFPLLDVMVKHGDYSEILKIPVLSQYLSLIPNLRLRGIFSVFIASIIAAVCIKGILTYVSELVIWGVMRDGGHVLRTRLFNRYLGFSKAFYDRHKVGNLCDLAIGQASAACDIFYYLHMFVQYSLNAVVFLVVLLFISVKLTAVSLLLLPALYLFTETISKKILASSAHRFDVDQQLSSRLFESISNMSLIRSSCSEGKEAERFERLSDSSRRALFSIWKKISLAPHVQEIILTAVIAALFAIGVFVFLKGQLEGVAALLSFFVVLRRFSSSINSLNTAYIQISKVLVPINKLMWVFDDEDKEFIVTGSKRFEGLAEKIEFRRATLDHGVNEVLRDVDLTIRKGKMTAIVGHTGSGKTSLISLIPRFYDLTSGVLLIDGVNIKEFDLVSLRKKIALVEQEPAILNDTIKENMLYGLETGVSQASLDEVARQTYLYQFVTSLADGYGTLVGDRGVRLSGGEKQRIALARAILKNPDIFILDEATSSMDVETERSIQEAMDVLLKNRTVIVIAHRLVTIKKADHIAVLEAGKIVEQGSLQQLLARAGRFNYYWNLQVFSEGKT